MEKEETAAIDADEAVALAAAAEAAGAANAPKIWHLASRAAEAAAYSKFLSGRAERARGLSEEARRRPGGIDPYAVIADDKGSWAETERDFAESLLCLVEMEARKAGVLGRPGTERRSP